ncbi:MAG: VOC family protein [Bacteroidales bacterium]|nr:VOC family protein [Bacteroidales bacterium]
MATVNVYLNFPGNCEEAFNFYRSVFESDFQGGIMRFRDVPHSDNAPPMPEDAKNMVMHVSLPILGGSSVLMGSDAPASMGFNVRFGNNVYINLQPETRYETQRLFTALANGGKVEMELQDMFWGDYYGALTDKYGVQWMFNCSEKV